MQEKIKEKEKFIIEEVENGYNITYTKGENSRRLISQNKKDMIMIFRELVGALPKKEQAEINKAEEENPVMTTVTNLNPGNN